MSRNLRSFPFFDPKIRDIKPPVAISACLNGRTVRYDAIDKSLTTRQWLSKYVKLLEHCPEVSVGMPTPRPAVQLVTINGSIHVLEREKPDVDVTAPLTHHREENLTACLNKNICAYIFKSKSPSCGIGTTPIHDTNGKVINMGNGLHADYFLKEMPWIIYRNENQVQTVKQCEQFVFLCRLVYDLQCSIQQKQLCQFDQHYQFFLHKADTATQKKLANALNVDDTKCYQTLFKIEAEKRLTGNELMTFNVDS